MARIVVGVDGSKESIAALRWAIEEARLRQLPVVVVHAWVTPAPPWQGASPGEYSAIDTGPADHAAEMSEVPNEALRHAQQFVEAIIEEATLRQDPGVQVVPQPVEGMPAEVLIAAAADARMVVVGSRGRGGFKELLLGSVSHQVVLHAPCPVLVIPKAAVEE